jgi:hypothetical protein
LGAGAIEELYRVVYVGRTFLKELRALEEMARERGMFSDSRRVRNHGLIQSGDMRFGTAYTT